MTSLSPPTNGELQVNLQEQLMHEHTRNGFPCLRQFMMYGSAEAKPLTARKP